MAIQTKKKDPHDVLDYEFPWATWLGSDTITSFTIRNSAGSTVADAGTFLDSDGAAGTLVKNSATNTTTSVTVWLSAGAVGKTYPVTCRIVTVGGRTKDKTMNIKLEEQ